MDLQRQHEPQDEQPGAPRLDPVCGMVIDAAHPKGGKLTYQGKEHGFCSPRCLEKFRAAPETYL